MPRLPRRSSAPFLALTGLALLAGCATPPPAGDPEAMAEYRQNNDPLEPTNRVFYSINNALDSVLLAPIARGYRAVVPAPVRNGLHNVVTNLSSPTTLVNDMMDGKPRRAGDTFMRMVINTTVGVGGIFDVAKNWGWPAHDSDFGLTLALWGVDGGPFLFLPVLGPSNPRDAAGFGVNMALDPFTYIHGDAWRIFGWSRFGVSAVDARERHLDDVDQIKKTALDPYATFRSLYQQFRVRQLNDLRSDNRQTVPIWFPQPTEPEKPPPPPVSEMMRGAGAGAAGAMPPGIGGAGAAARPAGQPALQSAPPSAPQSAP